MCTHWLDFSWDTLDSRSKLKSTIKTDDGIDLYTSAVDEVDIQDMGEIESHTSEKDDDDCQFITAVEHNEQISELNCKHTVHKAKIPVVIVFKPFITIDFVPVWQSYDALRHDIMRIWTSRSYLLVLI